MSTETIDHYQGLQDFAKAMPPATKINHTNGFDHCAIGAYGMTVGINPGDHDGYCDIMDSITKDFEQRFNNYSLRYILTSPGLAQKIIPTYGKLAEWLETPNDKKATDMVGEFFGSF